MNKLLLYYHTLKFLRGKQIVFRLFYFVRSKWRKATGFSYKHVSGNVSAAPLQLQPSITSYQSYISRNSFVFLNEAYSFGEEIDWGFTPTGKLWSYNLNYFEFLEQAEMSKEAGTMLIKHFISHARFPSVSFEPFPISLRLIFWIRFLAKHQINNEAINQSIAWQADMLSDNIEYHLLGNHVLENGFALLHAAYFLQNDGLYSKAKKILLVELDEQILDDGAHFELSPMYHQIMLYRVLDCINLAQNNRLFFDNGFVSLLQQKASLMLGWVKQMTFSNGDIPLFNDSAFGIAPSTKKLLDYANQLQVETTLQPLSSSGYRKLVQAPFELIADVGEIGPTYLAAHGHSDMLSFELFVSGVPFVVDTGTSTYEKNLLRQSEKNTSAHNTVTASDSEQSHIWDGFRVAERAVISIEKDTSNFLCGTCRHYSTKLLHRRSFAINETGITITDTLEGASLGHAKAYFHFHPNIEISVRGNTLILQGKVRVNYDSKHIVICTNDYFYGQEFGKRIMGTVVEISFAGVLKTHFQLI